MLRRTRNLCLSSFLEAVRDQTRIVDLKQINRVLLQRSNPTGDRIMTAPSHNPAPRWTRKQIRAARLAPVLPLLQRRGLKLRERDAGNFDVDAYPKPSSKTATRAGLNATWLATPSTSP